MQQALNFTGVLTSDTRRKLLQEIVVTYQNFFFLEFLDVLSNFSLENS